MKKPKVNTRCVANYYASPSERIVEFSSNEKGGLISFRENEDGEFFVQLYRMDNGIFVSVTYDEGQAEAKPTKGGNGILISQGVE